MSPDCCVACYVVGGRGGEKEACLLRQWVSKASQLAAGSKQRRAICQMPHATKHASYFFFFFDPVVNERRVYGVLRN